MCEKFGGGVLAGIGLHRCGGIALCVLSRLFGLSGNCWLLVNIFIDNRHLESLLLHH